MATKWHILRCCGSSPGIWSLHIQDDELHSLCWPEHAYFKGVRVGCGVGSLLVLYWGSESSTYCTREGTNLIFPRTQDCLFYAHWPVPIVLYNTTVHTCCIVCCTCNPLTEKKGGRPAAHICILLQLPPPLPNNLGSWVKSSLKDSHKFCFECDKDISYDLAAVAGNLVVCVVN